jgi:CheY-like chemotaxis protein
VVDDDELVREVAKAALEIVGGWTVRTAHSGVDAHDQARRERPDVMLLDVMMPGVDGPRTLEALRGDPVTRDIPVIFLTAKTPAGEGLEWRGLRLAGVIPKPFDPMTLAVEMSTLLGWET